ncbi:Clp Protease copy 4 (nucleomorph) [Lotharella oceanica]|uniref:Clp Protease copy 4 n=1 Tax=Lotharella oceanica TaxID=641309 RepID=A0A060DB79_9EUKA|nr:Clp Protease copy 4 [Lotharella oceanica]|mmetsp:Transcript_4841/g.9624  ORF Transcript_4841/g.9624 Transcript_4841/m.9624 type:complete len:191 (+) Transcript_4841:753-1325(+)
MFDLISIQMWFHDSIIIERSSIFVSSYINDTYSRFLFSNLIYLNIFSKNNYITFFLNGGEKDGENQITRFNNLLTFYDLIQQSKKKIKTYTIGLAYDEIMVIGGIGDKGQRFTLLTSHFGLSKPNFSFINTQATDFLRIKSEIIRINFLKGKILKFQTSKNIDKILIDIENDLLLNSFDAINYGIIDKIL